MVSEDMVERAYRYARELGVWNGPQHPMGNSEDLREPGKDWW